MTLVPPPLKVSPALLPVRVTPAAPPKVPFPARERLPRVSRTLALEKKLILPVEPSVRDWPLVVPSVPLPVRYAALLPVPEILAVGVPPATLVTANFAEAVEVPPTSRSRVVLFA